MLARVGQPKTWCLNHHEKRSGQLRLRHMANAKAGHMADHFLSRRIPSPFNSPTTKARPQTHCHTAIVTDPSLSRAFVSGHFAARVSASALALPTIRIHNHNVDAGRIWASYSRGTAGGLPGCKLRTAAGCGLDRTTWATLLLLMLIAEHSTHAVPPFATTHCRSAVCTHPH
jgi:hypothetical protein